MSIKSNFPRLLGFFLLASMLLSAPAYMQEQRGLGVGQASPAAGTGQ